MQSASSTSGPAEIGGRYAKPEVVRVLTVPVVTYGIEPGTDVLAGEYFLTCDDGVVLWFERGDRAYAVKGKVGVRLGYAAGAAGRSVQAGEAPAHTFEVVTFEGDGDEGRLERVELSIPVIDLKGVAADGPCVQQHRDLIAQACVRKVH